MPITPTNPFKGRYFPGEVIVQCVRWYLQYPLAYEHVSQLMADAASQWTPVVSGAGSKLMHRKSTNAAGRI
jgi:hypothetical protein